MRLDKEPFDKIKSGKKVLELRVYDEKRRLLKLGDEIEFLKRLDFKEKIKVKVIGLLIYETFSDLIKDLPASYLDYSELEKDDLIQSMQSTYAKEEEEKYGVVGIKVKLV